MKALSIQQPWAWAIIEAGKNVENRGWSTAYRGPVLIHASKQFDQEGYEWLLREYVAERLSVRPPEPPSGRHNNSYKSHGGYYLGGIIGQATITDCVTVMDSAWFSGPFGFVLADAKPLPFRPMRGYLSFFSVDE